MELKKKKKKKKKKRKERSNCQKVVGIKGEENKRE